MTVAPDRKRRFDWPHYHPPGVEIERYEAHGYPQATVVAACGREVAATLVTRTFERTRCPDCIAAGEIGGSA